jgi:hypothetical protein
MMFGLQTIDFFAQRGTLYFIHRAPPFVNEQLHISPPRRNLQVKKGSKPPQNVEFAAESPLA